MTKYINSGQLNVEYLTKVWKQDFAENYSDKPRLYSVLTNAPLTFELAEEKVKIIFPVANKAQKLWLEIKMLPEMTELFKSITGIQNLSIQPFVNESEEDDSIIHPTPPELSEEKVNVINFIKELELEPKRQYDERDII